MYVCMDGTEKVTDGQTDRRANSVGVDKRVNGRQAATDRWSSLLAFAYAGLAICHFL